jgi:hypothetical protein
MQTFIREGYLRHAAMAQAHRWFQIYENSETTLANQLDILTEDVRLKSGLGEGVGHAAYTQRISQLPETWKNAHRINDADFNIDDRRNIGLTLNVTYFNLGMKPDGTVRSADLTYQTKLNSSGTLLPKFSDIEIMQLSEGAAPQFIEAYPENRLFSLVNYWLAIIEDPRRDPEPAREVLTDGFKLNFPSCLISDFDGFKFWLAGPGSQVSASTHEVSNFSHKMVSSENYELMVDFDWLGILPDGKELIAKTRHTWNVTDNPKERFTRIKTIDVELLLPFQPRQ